MKPSFRVVSAAAASLLLCCASSAALAQAKFVLKIAHADSMDMTTSRKAVMADAFAREVKARSGGQIDVQVFGAGSLGGEKEIIEGVKNGFIQAGLASGVMENYFPSASVTDIPYLFPSGEVADKVMDGAFGQGLSAAFNAATGMHNLCFGEVGFRNFTTGKVAVHAPKDLAGLKIRVQQTPLYIAELKGLGAQPTPIAFPELYTALQTGVVDGEENPVPTIIFAKLYEVQKNLTLDGHNYGVDWFVLSDKFYKSLPPDLLKVVTDAAKGACTAEREVNRRFTVDGVKLLAGKGVQVYTPTPAEMAQFRAAAQPPVLDFLKTKIDPKLIDAAQAAVKEAQGK